MEIIGNTMEKPWTSKEHHGENDLKMARKNDQNMWENDGKTMEGNVMGWTMIFIHFNDFVRHVSEHYCQKVVNAKSVRFVLPSL